MKKFNFIVAFILSGFRLRRLLLGIFSSLS